MIEKMISDFIDEIYEEFLLPSAKEYDDEGLKERYASQFKEMHQETIADFGDDLEKAEYMIDIWKKSERAVFSQMSCDEIYSAFTKDEAYEEALECSSYIFSIACKKAKGEEITEEEKTKVADSYARLRTLYYEVSEYNVEAFENELSEAGLDAGYVLNNDKAMSIRLYRKITY